MRQKLKQFYLSWVNDFITMKSFAEHHDISIEDAETLISIGRKYHENDIQNVQKQTTG